MPPNIAAPQENIDAQVSRLAETIDAGETIPVIVGLDVPTQPEGVLPAERKQKQRGNIAAARKSLLNQVKGKKGTKVSDVKSFDEIPYVALRVDEKGLAELGRSPEVTSVVEDELIPSAERGERKPGSGVGRRGRSARYEFELSPPQLVGPVSHRCVRRLEQRIRRPRLDCGGTRHRRESDHPWISGKVVAGGCGLLQHSAGPRATLLTDGSCA